MVHKWCWFHVAQHDMKYIEKPNGDIGIKTPVHLAERVAGLGLTI